MTFYVLSAAAIPFAADLPVVVDQCEAVTMIAPMLTRATLAHPNEKLTVVETLFESSAAMPKIPPELARAVVAWNAMADRVRPKLPKIKAIGNYVGPYRRWAKKAIDRTYLLEDVVAAAERRADWHHFVHFGWLLGSKDGALNSEKIVSGNSFTKSPRRNVEAGEEFEGTTR